MPGSRLVDGVRAIGHFRLAISTKGVGTLPEVGPRTTSEMV